MTRLLDSIDAPPSWARACAAGAFGLLAGLAIVALGDVLGVWI